MSDFYIYDTEEESTTEVILDDTEEDEEESTTEVILDDTEEDEEESTEDDSETISEINTEIETFLLDDSQVFSSSSLVNQFNIIIFLLFFIFAFSIFKSLVGGGRHE